MRTRSALLNQSPPRALSNQSSRISTTTWVLWRRAASTTGITSLCGTSMMTRAPRDRDGTRSVATAGESCICCTANPLTPVTNVVPWFSNDAEGKMYTKWTVQKRCANALASCADRCPPPASPNGMPDTMRNSQPGSCCVGRGWGGGGALARSWRSTPLPRLAFQSATACCESSWESGCSWTGGSSRLGSEGGAGACTASPGREGGCEASVGDGLRTGWPIASSREPMLGSFALPSGLPARAGTFAADERAASEVSKNAAARRHNARTAKAVAWRRPEPQRPPRAPTPWQPPPHGPSEAR
mmetsp:Transcript_17291/g.65499  ORF Transcript_17291/g.65499 Transcript_17291/m.65499 type:complete len:300 (+) Transcript_17291:2190-3089(+)